VSLPRSARALTEAAATGEISPLDIVEGVLARIEASDGEIGAFLEVRAEEARAHARRLEASKDRGPLFGVPFAIKDNLQLAGWPITCASRIL
jgi:aspartyl-tRNA(Asn)/glutamyl-tRNA(Gln) amidotransferase subunit A